MFEKALKGGKLYWSWIAFLCILILIGLASYSVQWRVGLGITGMSKEVSWGLYIANFTFLVGVAASAVVVALPTYIYNQHKFEKMTTLGEFLAVAAVTMCVLFILVDLGRPMRALHVLLYPSPNSVMFFDMIVLFGYALWNIIIAWYILSSRITNTEISWYVKVIIYLAIPWAISIHTVTAYLYSGLVARGMWMTALLAPRFLASAFAAGPSLLIIAAIIAKKYANFDVGKEAIEKVAQIVTFAMIVNLFFLGCELFVVFYSQHPEHLAHWTYLLFGLDGHNKLVPWIWTSIGLGIFAVLMLIHPTTRKNEQLLVFACILIFISIWIDKGLGLIVPGYVPSMIHTVVEYWPTMLETFISLGVWGVGLLIFTVLAKMTIGVFQDYPTEEEVKEMLEKEKEEVKEAVEEVAAAPTPTKEYVCELCGAVFTDLDECCEHAEKEHKIAKNACDMVCSEKR